MPFFLEEPHYGNDQPLAPLCFRTDIGPPKLTIELEASLSSSPRTNSTLLSDDVLLPFVPVFLIRHPALVVESYYGAKGFPSAADVRRTTSPWSTSLRFIRALFSWYEAAAASSSSSSSRTVVADASKLPGSRRHPILVDADDMLEGDTMRGLAATIGMDPEQILQQWETRSTEGLDPGKKRFVQGLWTSTGIDVSRSSKGLDLETKFQSWNELHGVEVGEVLADLTRSQMEDYVWLKSRKF